MHDSIHMFVICQHSSMHLHICYLCWLLEMQASMFNDETSEFDVLVASDAIGMGLNLNISRVIFSTLKKFDGACIRDLTVPEIKQIAGSYFLLLLGSFSGFPLMVNVSNIDLIHWLKLQLQLHVLGIQLVKSQVPKYTNKNCYNEIFIIFPL